MVVTHFDLVDVAEKQLYIIPRVMMASDDAALASLFSMIIPNTNAFLIIRKRTNYLFLRELPAFQGRTITRVRYTHARIVRTATTALNQGYMLRQKKCQRRLKLAKGATVASPTATERSGTALGVNTVYLVLFIRTWIIIIPFPFPMYTRFQCISGGVCHQGPPYNSANGSLFCRASRGFANANQQFQNTFLGHQGAQELDCTGY